jgi:hypothetical protein
MAPRTRKQDLQTELNRVKEENTTLWFALHDLVVDPGSVTWLHEGSGAAKMSWGVVRPTSATGGFVIRRYEGGSSLNTDYLDHAIHNARERSNMASDFCDETRQQIENESKLAIRALEVRNKALAAHASAKRVA